MRQQRRSSAAVAAMATALVFSASAPAFADMHNTSSLPGGQRTDSQAGEGSRGASADAGQRGEQRQQRNAEQLEKVKAKLVEALDRRAAALLQRAGRGAEVTQAEQVLTEARSQVQAATTPEQVRDAVKSANDKMRQLAQESYQRRVQQASSVLLERVVPALEKASSRLTAAADQAETAGRDVREARQALDEVGRVIEQVRAAAQSLPAASPRDGQRQLRDALREQRESVRQAVQALRDGATSLRSVGGQQQAEGEDS